MLILFWINAFIIVWAMVGYPLSLKLIKVLIKRKNKRNYELLPDVTVMIVAHNEEQVIKSKLENIIHLDYPQEKIKVIVASDNSTDSTDRIVEEFINSHKEYDIKIFSAKEHKGKTNAQNEAQKLVNTEFLVMTDANAMLDKNAIRELMASFTSEDIVYVTGCLKYVNYSLSKTADLETTYWDRDTGIREIESNILTITAGNGALYACRNKHYIDFAPIQCHDSAMPLYYGLKKQRAISNKDALAYEKAGECDRDEFQRKVRMNRIILKAIIPDIKILNIFKYGWFSYFYFGHRTCRYLLWLAHVIIFISNMFLANKWIYTITLLAQIMFYLLGGIGYVFRIKNRYIKMITYYIMTIVAQWVGIYKSLLGKSKSTWEKAESTR